jgi:hypothetical protein
MALQQPDSLRAVLDSVFAAPRYRWVRRPDPLAALRLRWAEFKEWLQGLHDAHPLGYRLMLFAAVAILLAILIHAGWVFLRAIGSESSRADQAPGPDGRRQDEAWYRREADRLASQGRFADAIQADFIALLLALDARRVLKFDASKTPGEYASETRLAPDASRAFRELVRNLYGYAFARWPCGPVEFAEWRTRAAVDRYAAAN